MTCRLLGFLLFTMVLLAQSPGEGVSRELARARAGQISDLRYRIWLELAPDSDRLPGRIEILGRPFRNRPSTHTFAVH